MTAPADADALVALLKEARKKLCDCKLGEAVPDESNGCTTCGVCFRIDAALTAAQQKAQEDGWLPVEMPEAFAQWFESQVPPGTVISNPRWWAPKIHRAMSAALLAKVEGRE